MKQRVRLSKCKKKHSQTGFSHMGCRIRFHDVFGNFIDSILQARRSAMKSRERRDSQSCLRSREDWWRYKNA